MQKMKIGKKNLKSRKHTSSFKFCKFEVIQFKQVFIVTKKIYIQALIFKNSLLRKDTILE